MPASMISEVAGGRWKVMGSSMAMVATAPMPGSTPISVPSSTPTKQNSRFCGSTATCRPMAMLESSSMAKPSARPDGNGQAQALDEDQGGERRQHGADQRRLALA